MTTLVTTASLSNVKWNAISISTKTASIDFKPGGKPTSKLSLATLAGAVSFLLEDTGGSKLSSDVVKAMVSLRIVSLFFDFHTSPMYGPKTKRLNFRFPDYVIVPVDSLLPGINETISAIGKKTKMCGCDVRSDFDINVVITEVQSAKIPDLLSEHPEWFCGDLGLEGSYSVKGEVNKSDKGGKATNSDGK